MRGVEIFKKIANVRVGSLVSEHAETGERGSKTDNFLRT